MVRDDDATPSGLGQTARVPTVRALLEVLGPAVTLAGTGSLDVEVSEVVLLGPGDPVPQAPDALLVCTQALPAGPVTAAGLVVKGVPDPTAYGVPVLVADDALPWNHLLQLLTTAVAVSGTTGAVGDLFAFANSVAALVGGAVAVEDPQRRVLAYSSLEHPIDEARRQGILGRMVPHFQRNDGLYRDVQRAPGVIRVPADGDVLPRLAVAVRSGAELLGSIWVVEATAVDEVAEQALLDASRQAALHLLRARAGAGLERRARGELLRGLLDGRAAPDLAGVRLGLDVSSPVTVLAFSLPQETASDELAVDAVADLVQLQCVAVRPRSSVLVELGTAYALVPGDVSRARLAQLATAVGERARTALRVELGGGVGGTVAGLHEVAQSRRDADAVLRLVAPGEVSLVEDVVAQVVLLDLQRHLASSAHLRLPAVDRMLRHDAEQGTPYAASVLAYLAANADVPAAAESVNVHPNTFRYRLRRVRELFGVDLADADVRLVVWLQLRTRR
ncbi:MAG: PucR family transcriptional regulator [Frankiales bacterium]|nr:PucR family transcriptional regulator [Frankiales bacterium]